VACTLEAVISCLSYLCFCSVWRFVGRAHWSVWEPRLPLSTKLPALLSVGYSRTHGAHSQSRAAGLWSWAISGGLQTPAESELCFIVFIIFFNLFQTFHSFVIPLVYEEIFVLGSSVQNLISSW